MRVIDDGVPVDDLIKVVKASVRRGGVSRVSGPGDLQVTSVRLNLQVIASKSGGAGLSLRVPVIGAELRVGTKITRQDTHAVDIKLVPPEQLTRQTRGGDVENALVSAIATIRQTMASAAGGDDPWVLSESSVDITFVVTKTGNISLGAEGELTHEVTQSLRLGLAPPGK